MDGCFVNETTIVTEMMEMEMVMVLEMVDSRRFKWSGVERVMDLRGMEF